LYKEQIGNHDNATKTPEAGSKEKKAMMVRHWLQTDSNLLWSPQQFWHPMKAVSQIST